MAADVCSMKDLQMELKTLARRDCCFGTCVCRLLRHGDGLDCLLLVAALVEVAAVGTE